MNTLLRKEFRLLMPAWIAALVAAATPFWLWHLLFFPELWLASFGAAALFLGLAPFGEETSCGTFGLLLSQPEKRERIWKIKAGLLALALLSAWAMFTWCWRFATDRLQGMEGWYPLPDMAGVSGLVALLAFSGGLWSTLLLRDMATAFFATVLVPLIIFGATESTAAFWQGDHPGVDHVVYLALSVYTVSGYFVARRLFLGAEDVPRVWTGGQISLPKARLWPFRWAGFGFQEKRDPWSALIRKELQLQEITMVLVPLFAFLQLALLALRHFAPQWAWEQSTLGPSAVLVWMMASWVIGCVAVAEERRYSTLESSLCLPVRHRHQFAVKLAVVMVLGTVVGGVAPWVLEHLGGADDAWTGLEPLKELVLAAAAVTAIAFFASTMSRGMLQAFAVALFFSFLFTALLVLMEEVLFSPFGSHADPRAASLFELLAWPAMIAACIGLAYRNYRSLQTGSRLWAVNFAWLAAVFAAVFFVSCAGSGLLKIYVP